MVFTLFFLLFLVLKMQTLPTILGDDLVLHRVIDESFEPRIKGVLRDMANDDAKVPRYPGPNPISLDTSHFPQLRREPYYICEKTDGVRYGLACMTLLNASDTKPTRVCCLFDRSMAVYLLPLRHVPTAMFQGSLLDGELVRNTRTGGWEYLIFDAVVVSGVPVLDSTLNARMEAVHHVMHVYKPDARDPVILKPKTFFPCAQLEAYAAHAKTVPYEIDGAILTPAIPPVVYGRHFGMFKLKDGSRHTVDFVVGPDGLTLSVFDKNTHVVVGRLEEPAPPGSIAECHLLGGDTWKVAGIRTDKSTANDMFTYQKTLLNMREGLTLDSIKPLFL